MERTRSAWSLTGHEYSVNMSGVLGSQYMEVSRAAAQRRAIGALVPTLQRPMTSPHGRSRESGDLPSAVAPQRLIGKSPAIQKVRKAVRLVGPRTDPVLITGEPGTGKELVARALHGESGRRSFRSVSCASLPSTLADSLLFGHVRGAFTGAKDHHQGAFRAAGKGTLFLDEVGELPFEVQPKLLRALDPGEFSPVGSLSVFRTQARVIAATNREPVGEPSGPLRTDLLSRLGAVRIHLPPVRHRGGDIELLLRHYLGSCQVSPEAWERLVEHPWDRGNVRELKAVLVRARLLADNGPITLAHLETDPVMPGGIVSGCDAGEREISRDRLEDVKRRHVLRVLRECYGNRTVAARALGIDRRTLQRMLNRWGVSPQQGHNAAG